MPPGFIYNSRSAAPHSPHSLSFLLLPPLSSTMSSSPKKDSRDFVKHSKPIPIGTTHSRHRSASTSSSSDSSTSPSEPQTPLNNSTPPRTIPTNISPSTSPILSYFIGNSPTKTATFPFNRNFPGRPPVFEGLLLASMLRMLNITLPDCI